MASTRASWWKCQLTKHVPFLFRTCVGFNKHWRWERVCYCVVNENCHGIMLRTKGNRWLDTGITCDIEVPHA